MDIFIQMHLAHHNKPPQLRAISKYTRNHMIEDSRFTANQLSEINDFYRARDAIGFVGFQCHAGRWLTDEEYIFHLGTIGELVS